uniref:RRM domain-containing protein n=1 Tax=Calcidiscus leptoporus TaxID=127549 RepID=A0A7S0J6G1_9EUKA|mmetsp:Transcript_4132/g.9366  ORF Transcript_4132/g.9366 Transcript_4132/m.9366 type:complete len:195 (+) Transcript_4132:38-622(+)
MCSQASYEIRKSDVGEGRRVKCSNCGHTWYQTAARLSSLPRAMELIDYPAAMKARLEAGLPAEMVAGFRAYVGNLPFGTSEEELEQLFEPFGNIVGVDILVDEDGRPRGFGFVNLEKEEDGKAAVEALNGHKLNGRPLTVSEGKTPAGRGGRGGGGGRGRGGRGEGRGQRGEGRGGWRGRGDGRGRGRGRGPPS